MFSQLYLCSAKRICFYCQDFQKLITDSVSRWGGSQWVGGLVVRDRLAGGSMVRGFNKTHEKTCLV